MDKCNLVRMLLSCVLCSLIALTGCYIQVGYCGPRAKYERTVQLVKPMSAGSAFAAKSHDGWVNITGSDVADCNVTATIIVKADSDSNARRIAEETKLRLEQFGNKLTLKIEKPILLMNQSVDIRFKAMVMKNCDVELRTDDGDITVENIIGNVDVQTDDGSVTVSRVDGGVKIRANDGTTKVLEVKGDVDVKSDDGRIIVVYSENANGICNVSLVADDGTIDFTAPEKFSAKAEVVTDDGSVNTNLPINVVGKIGKNGIRGTIGSGDGRLYIKTDDGSIKIK